MSAEFLEQLREARQAAAEPVSSQFIRTEAPPATAELVAEFLADQTTVRQRDVVLLSDAFERFVVWRTGVCREPKGRHHFRRLLEEAIGADCIDRDTHGVDVVRHLAWKHPLDRRG